MPHKLRPLEDIATASLQPGQINMANVVEIGPEESGDPGQCHPILHAGRSSVAYDTVCRRVAESTVEFGEQVSEQVRMIVGMEQGAYDRLEEKEKLVEVGTSRTGAKQYLLKEAVIV